MLIIQRRASALILVLSMLLCGAAAPSMAFDECSAEACILMAEDGTALYEHNADEALPMASTTKLMTALICLESCGADELVEVKESHCAVEGSSMYLRPDLRYTVRELLLGLMLASGNDAALALAEHAAGSVPAFVRLMNRRARELGLRDTRFANPHGLDAAGHFSSARDLAKLMLACMEREDFRALTATSSAEVGGETLLNHNRLLSSCPGCIGGKTGYTSRAGRCLVSCCERDGLLLVCVTLSDPHDWADHSALYDRAYRLYVRFDPEERLDLEVPVISGNRQSVRLRPKDKLTLLLPRNAEIRLQADLPRFAFAPVRAGDTAGSVRVILDNKVLAQSELIYAEDAALAYPV